MNRKFKIVCLICIAALALLLAGCGGTDEEQTPPPTEPENITQTEPEPEPQTASSDVLIAYFSWANNAVALTSDAVDAISQPSIVPPGDTGIIAQFIEERVPADVFEIRITELYSNDFDECLDQARNQRDAGIRPELASRVENIADYDVIFLGFPNWWYTIPVSINSFVEAHDLAGKTIIPFVCHGTGGLAGTIDDLTAALPSDCTILQPFDVAEEDALNAQPDVNAWLEALGY